MKLYMYAEHCQSRAGSVYGGDDPEENDDVFLYAEGTDEEIAANARESLNTRYDHRAGGAGDSFRWRCDRAALAAIGCE